VTFGEGIVSAFELLLTNAKIMSNDADTTMQQDSWFFSEKNDTRLQFDSGPIAYF
jgi:hypothetical protein